MQRIRVVLVGLGHMGAFHFRVLREDPRFELVAVVDPVLAALPEGAPAIPLLRSLDQAQALDFQLALIAAPTEWHDTLVEQALEQGRHVFVEKPAASTPEKAYELVQLARSRGLALAVGHVERCNPVVAALQSVVQSGILGRIVHVSGVRAGGWPRHVKRGNNVIVDLAVHELDVFRLLLGPLRIVHSVGHCTRDPEIMDTAELSLLSQDGVSASIHVNWHTPQRLRTIRVTGTQAVVHVDYLTQTAELVGINLSSLPQWAALGLTSHRDGQQLERASVPVVVRESLKIQLDHVFAMLQDQPHQLAHGEELIESVDLLSEAQRLAQLTASLERGTLGKGDRSPRFAIPNA